MITNSGRCRINIVCIIATRPKGEELCLVPFIVGNIVVDVGGIIIVDNNGEFINFHFFS